MSDVTTINEITPIQVSFYSDEVPAFQANDGEIYAAANKVLRNIGFNEDRVKAIRIKWRDDEVVSKGGRNFNLLSKGGIQSTYCLPCKILPLALAKISITPELKKSYPETVEKLVRYQLECADVLYKHFIGKSNSYAPTVSPAEKHIDAEEFMMYLVWYIQGWQTFANDITTQLKDTTNVIQSLAASTQSLVEQMKQIPHNNFATTPSIKSTVDPEIKKWLDNAWNSAEIISRKTGKSKVTSLIEVYKIMRTNGIDVTALYDKYKVNHPGAAKIKMCAESPDLRAAVESAFKELHRKYYPNMYSTETFKPMKKVYKSQLINSTPPEIREIITNIKSSASYNRKAMLVYREIGKRTGVNLKEEAHNYAIKNGYLNCSQAYYISIREEYLNILKQITEV